MSNCLKVINIDHDILQLYIANIMKRRPNTTLLEWTAILLILASVLALVLQLVSYQNIRSNLQFGMTIAGVPVGGMTLGDAEDTLTRVYATPVELHFQNDVFYLEPAEISFRLETESMLAIARRRSSGSSFPYFRKKFRYCCWDISLIADGSVGLGKTTNLIVSNSLLHHIQNPHKFWEALKALSSKGTVHFHRDLRRPSSLNEAIDLQKTYLGNSPQVLVNDYLASLQASFTVAEVKSQLRNEGLDQLNVFEVEDRYLDVVGIF